MVCFLVLVGFLVFFNAFWWFLELLGVFFVLFGCFLGAVGARMAGRAG